MPSVNLFGWNFSSSGGLAVGVPGVAKARVGITSGGNVTLDAMVSAFGLATVDLHTLAKRAATASQEAVGGISALGTEVSDGFAAVGSASDVAAAVWAAELADFFGGGSAANQIKYMGYMGWLLWNMSMLRWWSAPWFGVIMGGHANEGSLTFADLGNISPSAKLPGETDLEMMERLQPGFTWQTDVYWPGSVSAEDSTHSPPVTYVYRGDSAPTLEQIKALWNYVPASGPPGRNGIEDFMSIVSLLPIQF